MQTRTFGDATADYVWVWGIVPPHLDRSRGEQTTELFEEMERVLAAHGLTFANVVRTWFYNDDINGWYAEFNAARTRFFESRHVFETFLPASTGIGHGNPFGAALVSGFFAMRPKAPSAVARIVKSPLQADAMSYRSSFSRAAEVESASGRRLFVSGTASILPDSSEVAFLGDYDRQVDCAMRAALADAGMSPADIGYLNLHGTGTPANDAMELKAVARVFGDVRPRIESTKALTGHCLGAAGAVEAALCWLYLASGHVRGAAMSNSFAFGGSNASIVLAREATA